MRITLPIAAALVLSVAIALVHPHLRAASPQDGQQPASALAGIQITGRVVSGDPPVPLSRALVAALANGKLVASALTDASGRFAIDTPATVTSLVISKQGFATTARQTNTNRTPLEPLNIALTRAATVSGRVIDAEGRPIASIGVRAVPLKTTGDTQPATAVTDDRGTFRIGGLAPGAYSIVSDGHPEYQRSLVRSTLSAESVLILQQMPSPVSPTSNPLTFQAREGSETTATLVYRETAVILSYAEVGGVVTGRVVDEAGEPAPGLTVRLSRVGGAGTGAAEISNVPRVTDDRGEYRLFHIAAGQYFLLVSDETRNASINEPSWLPVYYPGSMAAIDAIPLTVGRSQEQAGIDVIFSRSRGTRVSGYVFNAAGQPLRTQVRLAAPSPLSGMQVPTRIALTKDDGAFEFGGVPPGQYTLRASNTQPSATIVLSLAGSQLLPERLEPAREYGLISVSAHGDELGPVVVQTRPGASISGRLVLETSGPLSSRPVFTFVAMAAGENFPMSEQPSAMLQATVDAELQSFKINGLSGTMRLRLTAGSKNWWLKSATVNGIDATDSPITLTSSQDSTNDAIFVLADTAGSVSGRALSGTQPTEEGWAVAFAVEHAQRFTGSPRIVSIPLGNGGRFTASGLPPGDYYIAAVDGSAALPQNEARFRDLLEDLTPRARRVSVGPRQAVTLSQNVQAVTP